MRRGAVAIPDAGVARRGRKPGLLRAILPALCASVCAIAALFSCELLFTPAPVRGTRPLASPAIPDPGDITFVVVSDPQIAVEDPRSPARAANRRVVEEIGLLSRGEVLVRWPEGSAGAGETVARPVAVLLNGDLTNWAHPWQLEAYARLYDEGWDESDEGVKPGIPAFPGLGNHDLCQTRGTYAGIMRRYVERKVARSPAVRSFDPYTKNYSWDWGDFHFVQLNLWAGDIDWSAFGWEDLTTAGSAKAYPGVRARERHRGLDWLRRDLALHASGEAKRVIVLQHAPFGYDDVWDKRDRDDTIAALEPYRIAGIFCGHTHRRSARTVFPSLVPGWGDVWQYAGGHGGWDYGFDVNQGELGFLVVRARRGGIDVGFYPVRLEGSPSRLLHLHSREF